MLAKMLGITLFYDLACWANIRNHIQGLWATPKLSQRQYKLFIKARNLHESSNICSDKQWVSWACRPRSAEPGAGLSSEHVGTCRFAESDLFSQYGEPQSARYGLGKTSKWLQ